METIKEFGDRVLKHLQQLHDEYNIEYFTSRYLIGYCYSPACGEREVLSYLVKQNLLVEGVRQGRPGKWYKFKQN